MDRYNIRKTKEIKHVAGENISFSHMKQICSFSIQKQGQATKIGMSQEENKKILKNG